MLHSLLKNNDHKKYIATKILNNKIYYDIKCLKNLVIEYVLEDGSILKGNYRLHLILDYGDEIQLKRLLTSPDFTKKEFNYVDERAVNCIMKCMINKTYSMLPLLVSSNFFDVELLKTIDNDGNNIKHYIHQYCEDNEYARGLYKLIYSTPLKVIEGEEENDATCKICFERKVNILLLPCGHTQCTECISIKSNKCPFCSTEIADFHQIRFS